VRKEDNNKMTKKSSVVLPEEAINSMEEDKTGKEKLYLKSLTQCLNAW
jgi:hypothetical protein